MITENTLIQSVILCFAILVYPIFDIEAHIIWSFWIDCVDQIGLKYGSCSFDLSMQVSSDPSACASCCVAVTHQPIRWSQIYHTGDLPEGDQWPRITTLSGP